MSITTKDLTNIQAKLGLRFKQVQGCCPSDPRFVYLLLVEGEKRSGDSSSDEDDDIWVCIPNALHMEHFRKRAYK